MGIKYYINIMPNKTSLINNLCKYHNWNKSSTMTIRHNPNMIKNILSSIHFDSIETKDLVSS